VLVVVGRAVVVEVDRGTVVVDEVEVLVLVVE